MISRKLQTSTAAPATLVSLARVGVAGLSPASLIHARVTTAPTAPTTPTTQSASTQRPGTTAVPTVAAQRATATV